MAIKTLQTIIDFQTCAAEHPKWSQNAIEDYQGKGQDIDTVVDLINNGDLSPLSGSGSPEAIVTANYSLMYIDTAALPTPTLFFNPVFEAKTGWIALP